MELFSDLTYAISKKVAKDNRDSIVGTIAVVIMAVATILKLVSIFYEEENDDEWNHWKKWWSCMARF